MVQEFMILRCFSCTTFQVHQVKKSKKWVCKVCGEKQSVKKLYAQGSGQDCRKHVQKLNMKCGEAEMVKDLAYGSDENNNYCHFTENNPNDDNVMLDKSTTREGHTSLPAGKSKWNRFLKVDSNDDNGEEDFNGCNVTTERDEFDKASSRGKRKSAWQGGKTKACHQQKRLKNKANENHINPGDLYSTVFDKDPGNIVTSVKHFYQSSPDLKMQALSSNALRLYGVASEEQCDETQSCSSRLLPCDTLQSNAQTGYYKCNMYFAKATRDSASVVNKVSDVSAEGKKATSCSSRWTKFLPSYSTQSTPPDTTVMVARNSQMDFMPTDYLNNTTLPSQQCKESRENNQDQHVGCNSLKLGNSASDDSHARSVVVEDLFKVDDDLDGEWWDSL